MVGHLLLGMNLSMMSVFGIVALANSFVMFAQFVARLGLTTAIIQKADVTDDHKTAAFWGGMAFCGGLVLLLLMWLWWRLLSVCQLLLILYRPLQLTL